MYSSCLRLDLFPCTYFALWLPQCHIKYLRFRYINITLQALEQDREYIKHGTNDNTHRLFVDESVSPHTERKRKRPRAEVSIQCFNSSYFIQSTLNKSRSLAYREMERESRLRVIVLEHEGVGGATHKSCTCVFPLLNNLQGERQLLPILPIRPSDWS